MTVWYLGARSVRSFVPLVAGLLAACVTPTETMVVVAWEGELAAVGNNAVAGGTMAMVANQASTQLGVGVSALAGSQLSWSAHQGSCTTPGARVGPASLYPALNVGTAGQAEAATLLNRRVDIGGPYIGVIRSGSDGSGPILACGDLVRLE